VVAALALLPALASLGPPAAAVAAPAPTVESADLLLVGFDEGLPVDAAILQAVGGTVLRVDERLGFALVWSPAPAAFAAAVRSLPGIAYVERDHPMHLFGEPPAPSALPVEELEPQQWGLRAIRAPEAWALAPPKADGGIEVAILDTGSDWHHPDLGPALWNGNGLHGEDLTLYASAAHCALAGWWVKDCFYLQRPPEEVLGPMDFHGHGSHVAGIAGGVRDGQGIVGVSQATIRTYKVLPTGQSFFSLVDVVASGIALAASEDADIISLSLGCWCQSASLERAVRYAWDSGALVVAAAGNADDTDPAYPASFPEVISVSAIDPTLGRWVVQPGIGSSYGEHIDLAAPGADILGPRSRWAASFGFYWVGLGHVRMSGTSMATPHVAGVAALVWQAAPHLTNAEVRAVLEGSARDLGAPGWDQEYGHGLVDAEAAVQAALAQATPGARQGL
jgi:subtilisin family serine protease